MNPGMSTLADPAPRMTAALIAAAAPARDGR
jgi:hypothetical protein